MSNKVRYVVYDMSQLTSDNLNIVSGGIVCLLSISDKIDFPRFGLLLAAKLQEKLTLCFDNYVEIKQLNEIVEIFNEGSDCDCYFNFDVIIGDIEQRLSIQKIFQHWEKKSSIKNK